MTPSRSAIASSWAIAVLAPFTSVMGQEIRLGSEFRVNAHVVNSQIQPAIAVDAEGDFVVVWQSYGQYGSNSGFDIFARRYSSAGTPLDTEFLVNTSITDWQFFSDVAADSDGDFVVVWSSDVLLDGWFGVGVFAQRFSSAGGPLASEFQVSAYTSFMNQAAARVAASASGDFVVVWERSIVYEQSYSIFARRFSSAGSPLATEIQVNTYSTGFHRLPDVATDAEGDFVVVWTGPPPGGGYRVLFARRFSSAGAALSDEFQVNSYPVHYRCFPSVASDTDGDFVVAWESDSADGLGTGVFARRFSSAGGPLVDEFQVNSHTVPYFSFPAASADADGDFVVAWNSQINVVHSGGALSEVFARRFSSAGVPLASEFQVNTYTTNEQRLPAVAAAPGGDFVVTWESFGQDRYQWGVFAQRFAVPTSTATATATASATATPTATPTGTPTATATPAPIYEVPTLSRGALAVLALFLLTVCIALLARRPR